MYLKVERLKLGETDAKLDSCEGQLLEGLVAFIEGQTPIELTRNRTRGIKGVLNDLSHAGSLSPHTFVWEANPVLLEWPGSIKIANFRVTGKMVCCHCDHPKTLYVHLALNNREAIGTNLLRAGLAASAASQQGKLVLLTLGRELLNIGGWDKAYGDSKEYVMQFKEGYSRILATEPVVVEINSPAS